MARASQSSAGVQRDRTGGGGVHGAGAPRTVRGKLKEKNEGRRRRRRHGRRASGAGRRRGSLWARWRGGAANGATDPERACGTCLREPRPWAVGRTRA